jgi:hypothetical protein
MKSKRGRPKTLKAKEVKKPFPMRFSDEELKTFKQAAGDQPLRDWIRETLLAATPDNRTVAERVRDAQARKFREQSLRDYDAEMAKLAAPTGTPAPHAIASR